MSHKYIFVSVGKRIKTLVFKLLMQVKNLSCMHAGEKLRGDFLNNSSFESGALMNSYNADAPLLYDACGSRCLDSSLAEELRG